MNIGLVEWIRSHNNEHSSKARFGSWLYCGDILFRTHALFAVNLITIITLIASESSLLSEL